MEKLELSIPELFGKNVQKYRKIAGLTQMELSKRLDITQKHLSVIENGSQFASASLIAKISQELKVTPAALFGEDLNQRYFNNLYARLSTDFENKMTWLYSVLKHEIEETIKNDTSKTHF